MPRKNILLVPLIFLLFLALNSQAQIAIEPEPNQCPDKCENSIFYAKGWFDDKAKICQYDYHEDCKYECRDDKIFTTPSCNVLPTNNTQTSLEKIYEEITILKNTIPKATGHISVHGTEYVIGELGKVWVQVLDENNVPVNNASCFTHIYTPDGLQFAEKVMMSFLEDGVYDYDFLVPQEVGVYATIVECYYVSSVSRHNATSGIIDIGTLASGDYTSTWIEDGTVWRVNEFNFGGGVRNFQIRMNFTNITQHESQTGLTVSWTGTWNSAPTTDSATVYIMNFTSGQWIALSNKITDTGGNILTFVNTIVTTNSTANGILKNGTVSILINDTNISDGTTNGFLSDYVYVGMEAQFSSQYERVIGSGEIHVSSPLNIPYTKVTLCGEIDNTNIAYESACSIFTNDNEFSFPEGEIEDNITITALRTISDSSWSYVTPHDVSCIAIYWIRYYNGTEWVNVNLDTLTFSSLDGNCRVSLPIDFIKGTTYQYMIKMDNYMVYKTLQAKLLLDVINSTNQFLCTPLSLQNNYTYDLPISESTNLSNDTVLRACHFSNDMLYWGYLFYNQSTTVNVSGDYVGYLSELTDYIEPRLRGHLQMLIGYILQYNTNGLLTNIFTNTTEILSLLQYVNGSVSGVNDGIKFVGGTEYNTGEIGISSVQFIISNNPVEDGNCNITIYYPNGSIFVLDGNASYLSGSDGIYSYNFTVPSTIGVYREEFVCRRGSGARHYTSGSFHNANWANNITNIYELLLYMNVTQAVQFNSLYNLMLSVNSSINSKLDSLNATMVENFIAINENLTLIYNLVNASNATIMNKLFLIQDEIASLNQSIINGWMNVTNITANITLSQQEVINTMIALFGQQAKNRNYAYLGIGGGLTGFLTGGDSGAVYYCKDNVTLAQYSVQNITGSLNMTNIYEDLQHCTYGCVQNACVIPSYMIWLYVLLALLGVFFVYLWVTRETNGIVNTG